MNKLPEEEMKLYCPRCQEFIRTHELEPRTTLDGSDLVIKLEEGIFQELPRCGFNVQGYFISDNWSCQTLLELRKVNDYHGWNDDESIDVIHMDSGEFLILTYYKGRGRTGNATIMDETETRILSLEEAEKILELKKTIPEVCYICEDEPPTKTLVHIETLRKYHVCDECFEFVGLLEESI